MAVPKFDECMPEIIRCLGDGKVHTSKELSEYVSTSLKLSKEDLAETISSGYSKFISRVNWAKTYLGKAGLLESPKRGGFCLTSEGKKAFQNGPEHVTLEYLRQFDSFNEFQGRRKETSDLSKNSDNKIPETPQTPQEQIDNAIAELNENLADDLLTEIMGMNPYKFEALVVKLLITMGYGTLQENQDAVTKKSGDEGIDGIVSADKFGFDSIYIQAKHWKPDNTVGRPEIQKFLGAAVGQGATKGIFITTSKFSNEATNFASKQLNCKIVLINGQQLAKLMIDYDLGVSTVATYKVKRIDSDFFNDEV